MTNRQIKQLLLNWQQSGDSAEVIETHVSWIILCPHVVYKIPKNVRFPYLDFSSLEHRRQYCEREVTLNSRLTTGIYLDAVPVWCQDQKCGIEYPPKGAELINYAVKMKRIPQERLMRVMLDQHLVTGDHMQALAKQMAEFHHAAEKITSKPDIQQLQSDFADIRNIKSVVVSVLHEEAAGQLEEWIFDSRQFLRKHEARMLERQQLGFYREQHGDLHAENIFLLEEPVVFDCIAFNEAFRQGDLLNELAFFCMDMDYHRQAPLGHLFLQHYLDLLPCLESETDQQLFLYYKLYRANIRLKVNAIKWEQSTNTAEKEVHAQAIKNYYWLMRSYAKMLFKADARV